MAAAPSFRLVFADSKLTGRGALSISVRPEFYESDCQGRFSSSLIAFRCFPLQSAPSDPKRTIVNASGWAVQSSVADSCSVFSIDPCRDDCKRHVGRLEDVDHGSI